MIHYFHYLSLRSDDTPEDDEFLWWSEEATEADDSFGWLEDDELSSDSRLPTDLEVCGKIHPFLILICYAA